MTIQSLEFDEKSLILTSLRFIIFQFLYLMIYIVENLVDEFSSNSKIVEGVYH